MSLNPEPLWPIVLGQHQDPYEMPVPTWLWVVGGIVMLSFIGILCHLFWTHIVKKRPLRNSRYSGSSYFGGGDGGGDGGGGDGGGGCGGGGDGGG